MQEISITVLPENTIVPAVSGETLLTVLRRHGLAVDAPCNGNGACGKCKIQLQTADGSFSALACQTTVRTDMTVVRPVSSGVVRILTDGCRQSVSMDPISPGYLLAFDIGTTTVVCFLLHSETGQQLAVSNMLNPQIVFGADVVSRIQSARQGDAEALTASIRHGMEYLIQQVCQQAGISASNIGVVSVVANPCMQQLFLGLPVDNLVEIPFASILTKSEILSAASYLPSCRNACLLVVPDLSGYIGADTLACILATSLHQAEHPTLLVDIGTNGEMVLCHDGRLVSCATAAGPALEGARIQHGMRGTAGAIDRIVYENGELHCHVIGDCEAVGICGSGLLDAISILLRESCINRRGKLLPGGSLSPYIQMINGQWSFALTDRVCLTQADIREFQLAKGAIAAGISLMAETLSLPVDSISEVLLAGAFGSYLRPESACTTGLLPRQLLDRIRVVGNAAGGGAKMLACSKTLFSETDILLPKIEYLDLASLPDFKKNFATHMMFEVI